MPCSIRGSAMAVLDIGIDTAIVSPVRRTRRLGNLFWMAVGWISFIVLASIFAGVLLAHTPVDMDMLDRRGRRRGGRRRAWCTGSAPTRWGATNWRGFSTARGYRLP